MHRRPSRVYLCQKWYYLQHSKNDGFCNFTIVLCCPLTKFLLT
ncbi:hypothetical protein Plhal304r1_c011g0042191 [Plasmopara halstedii]